jgi:DNA-binding transcriptional LysR family regulator
LADRVVNLLEEHVDVALRIGELPDSSLLATSVGSVRRVVCASPAYLEARGTPAIPSDLGSHDCITFEGPTLPRSWTFWIKGKAQQIAIHSRLVVNTAESAIDMAMAGVGVTRVLSYQISRALAEGRITIVLPAFEPRPLPVSLVYSGNGLVPLKLRAFLDFATPRLKAVVARDEETVKRA